MRPAALLALFLLAAPLSAQDAPKPPTAMIAGNWDISFTSPQGTANWRVKFDQSGDTLRGTATTDFGALDVVDGWITGDKLSFTLNLNYNGTPITLDFAGTVKGDAATGQIDVRGMGIQPFPFSAAKAAGAPSSTHGLPSSTMRAEVPRAVVRIDRR